MMQAHDLGEALGCGAHLVTLRREASGAFDVEDAIPAAALVKAVWEVARIAEKGREILVESDQ